MSIFKAYDIRGTFPDQINKELAYKIGRAFVTFLGVKNVVVGKDCRESSDEIEEALMQGILDEGADVVSIGLCTTPMVYFTVAKFSYDSGIMITASHNPKEYNGLKLVREAAIPISGETGIKEIESLVIKNKFYDSEIKGEIKQISNIVDEYVLNELSYGNAKELKKFRIAIDYGNGMGSLLSKKFFSHLKGEFLALYDTLDGTFPNHEANPLKEETLDDVKEKIKASKADLGIAFDGDADRLFFLDEKANVISCDKINALIAKRLLKEHPGEKILYDLRSSKIVKEVVEKNGGIPQMCRVGHAFIKAQMRQENALFAAELSGHFYLRDNYFFESPFYVILKVLEVLSEENKPLSEIIKPLNKYYASGEINSSVKDKDAKMKELADLHKDAKEIFWLDGVSVIYDKWWFNVRGSNTEPLLRLNLEANTKAMMVKKRDEILMIIRR
ncbi:MAG: phosphomannomutase/phosphoglucomutase [archaeon]